MKWKFKRYLVKLLRLNNTPPEIALGTAIGVFIAILPVYGLHTVLVIIAAILVRRANKIAILLGTNISLPPTVPFITWAGYEIGRFILGSSYPALALVDFKNLTLKKVLHFYPPLFLGSVILGLLCAVIFYFLTYSIMSRLRKRKQHKKPAHHHKHHEK
ncbi:MAG: DUF2062 domain-containing protein [Candidatus Omnitrophica bacterium]|nr:DUF2062 domain-containing protein [Candidatus Omnitrophota bacterium]